MVRRALALLLLLEGSACCKSSDIQERIEDLFRDGGIPDGGPARDGGPDGGVGPTVHVATQGAAVAVTRDETVALVLNRQVGRGVGNVGGVILEKYGLSLDPEPSLMPQLQSPVDGAHQIIIGPDDNTAYLAAATEVVRISNLKGTQVGRQAGRAGSEPRGIALSPSGALLFVANWADGTVTIMTTIDMNAQRTVDLNGPLAESGMLGTLAGRPGLAHPWGVVVTDDGDEDDQDEVVYVTEFFSQARTRGVPGDDSAFDLGRQGVVYRFALAEPETVSLITLAARDTGFTDSNGRMTGCFPNQLGAVAWSQGLLFVGGVCASPRGPVGPVLGGDGSTRDRRNFKTLLHTAIYVVDTVEDREVFAQSRLLPRLWEDHYADRGTPDDESRRMPLIASGLAFLPDTLDLLVTGYGSDALFELGFDLDPGNLRVGADAASFIDLAPDARLPFGVHVNPRGERAYVVSEHSRTLSVVSLSDRQVLATLPLGNPNPSGDEAAVNDGRYAFVSGRGRLSLRGQAWSSCEACHPRGWTDGVTWFLRHGPRQTIPLRGFYSPMAPQDSLSQRMLNWTATADEVHDAEFFIRQVSGGVGAVVHTAMTPAAESHRIHYDGTRPVPPGVPMSAVTSTSQAGLSGSLAAHMPGGASPPQSRVGDLASITSYARTIRAPLRPSNLDSNDVSLGRSLFMQNQCDRCHSTDLWTLSRRFYQPSEITNSPNPATQGSLRRSAYTPDALFPEALNPPGIGGNTLRYVGTGAADDLLNDQIYCVLRAVGTFPATPDANFNGVAPGGVRVREVRDDMSTEAQGATGFNTPSLFAVGTSAPYFHAGNARTLEEVFDPLFAPHSSTFVPGFPGSGDRAVLVRQLVAFLTSIDEMQMAPAVPGPDPRVWVVCPVSF